MSAKKPTPPTAEPIIKGQLILLKLEMIEFVGVVGVKVPFVVFVVIILSRIE